MTTELTTELRDIHGLDAIPWYPLAWGWWVLLAAIIILGLIIFWYWRYLNSYKPKNAWRKIAMTEWQNLNAPTISDYERASKLAHLLRWVAIHNYGRETCAGLAGEAWLAWLTEHDPQQFAWQQHGKILIQLPYMPPDSQIEPQNLINLQRAAYYFIINTNK